MQLVFDSRETQQLKVLLDANLNLLYTLIAVHGRSLGLMVTTTCSNKRETIRDRLSSCCSWCWSCSYDVPTSKVIVFGLRENTTAERKRAQSLSSQVGTLFLEPVAAAHDLHHDDIGALHQEGDLAGVRVAHDDAHALLGRREGKVVEDLVGLLRAIAQRDGHLLERAVRERDADVLGELDESNLVGARRLVRNLSLASLFVVLDHWRHVVAQGQRRDGLADSCRLRALDLGVARCSIEPIVSVPEVG